MIAPRAEYSNYPPILGMIVVGEWRATGSVKSNNSSTTHSVSRGGVVREVGHRMREEALLWNLPSLDHPIQGSLCSHIKYKDC